MASMVEMTLWGATPLLYSASEPPDAPVSDGTVSLPFPKV
jgi:hypothetical protein